MDPMIQIAFACLLDDLFGMIANLCHSLDGLSYNFGFSEVGVANNFS